ncbi:DNA polymerase III subunit delta [Photobacterium phosphoreum]|uniref:DNA polymerase III subunit delta n=1 Tax=Photobacterium phosphoreum TaxID=659 RepID=UPI0005D33478|nr:DNA polymerase III subunit delta [Photobacterium phosphoreum]KJF85591.1 DNA polymerase III subunit delta [Photobacterium phosphoreum]PQJ91826.1 DNA polymerase III subunit delta [Photobacterium phosphoreum]PSU62001.1 DNA polymerase III subunit delta [Photobacterium phosphoreum]PSU63226.1 DNA polymerase III subunit delta [Photobacterium phosphoreum]PSV67722.1 DNA polymerase III subunit delta [Photobacterium phosphoreum]
MRVYPEQLTQQLTKGLRQAYLLFGNELLLKQEAGDSIKHIAQQHGFLERHSFTIDNSIDWNAVLDCCHAMSLFSAQQIIELEIAETGLNANQAKALLEVIDALHPDILLIITGPRINKKQESTKWFKALDTIGLYIPCNTPDPRQMPRFIQSRCQQLALKPDHESVQMLAQWHEGNLLALSQSLHKLVLLYPDGILTIVRLQEALSRHNHYTPFQLIDALLAGQAKRSQRILRQLQAEGVEATILLRTLQRELTQLYKMQEMGKRGTPLNLIFEQFRVWQNRREMYIGALHRLPLTTLVSIIRQLTLLEIQVKTDYDTQPWSDLSCLCAEMCGVKTHLHHLN